jgi:hypothetical protein
VIKAVGGVSTVAGLAGAAPVTAKLIAVRARPRARRGRISMPSSNLGGLLAPIERKNSWTITEHVGEEEPKAM